MTNYEKIKEMSLEEVAELMGEYADCLFCPMVGKCGIYDRCADRWKEWLSQEVKQ